MYLIIRIKYMSPENSGDVFSSAKPIKKGKPHTAKTTKNTLIIFIDLKGTLKGTAYQRDRLIRRLELLKLL